MIGDEILFEKAALSGKNISALGGEIRESKYKATNMQATSSVNTIWWQTNHVV